MNIDELVKRISKTDGLSKTLGMHFISTPEPDTLQATMKVDERNRQPFGFLSGGASLALAENVAGIGSLALCPGQIAVGIISSPPASTFPQMAQVRGKNKSNMSLNRLVRMALLLILRLGY